MAKFVGTNKEFKRYIGPQLRNLVQQLTKKHKATVGACEHCGATAELESAHLVGRDRNEIIDRILVSRTQNEIIDVDLLDFENDFKKEHTPIEKSILILCRTCHREYDGKNAISRSSGITKIDQDGRLLPISLEPTDPNEFKNALLSKKVAEIEIHYEDGRVDRKIWNASRFSSSSNVFGNLRSRPEFRGSKWQSHGITHVHVKIYEGR